MVDHLIISDELYRSLTDSGVFENLQESKRWILPYLLEKQARKEGKAEGSREKAKALKREAVDTVIIAKTSGLSIEEIGKL